MLLAPAIKNPVAVRVNGAPTTPSSGTAVRLGAAKAGVAKRRLMAVKAIATRSVAQTLGVLGRPRSDLRPEVMLTILPLARNPVTTYDPGHGHTHRDPHGCPAGGRGPVR